MCERIAATLLFISACFLTVRSLELRCYCNLPACVQTAYMCKSSTGCFQELLREGEWDREPRIGCLELWPKRKRRFQCIDIPRNPGRESESRILANRDGTSLEATVVAELSSKESGRERKRPISYLRCCAEDMCNYVAQKEPQIAISTNTEDHGVLKKTPTSDPDLNTGLSSYPWFRIAVVAVPVGGAVILVILIFLACTMLSSDRHKIEDSERLLASYYCEVVSQNSRQPTAGPKRPESSPASYGRHKVHSVRSDGRRELMCSSSDTDLICHHQPRRINL